MKNNTYWCGYLQAGDKSSLVVRDPELDTGNPATLYLFNFNRREILEYKREIVDPKLRELTPAETKQLKELERLFKEARVNFKGRTHRPLNIPETATVGAKPKKKELLEEGFDEGVDIDDNELEEEDWDDTST